MVAIDYLSSFEGLFATIVIVAVGVLCILLKQFTAKAISSIQRVVFLVPMAALLFREIGDSKLNGKTWTSFAHAAIVSVILHIITAIYSFITKKNKPFVQRFIETSMAYCESEFSFYSYMFASKVMTRDLMLHAAMAQFFQFLVAVPLHKILALYYIPDCVEKLNEPEPEDQDNVALNPKEKHEDADEKSDDGHELENDPSNPPKEKINLTGNPEAISNNTDSDKEDDGQPSQGSEDESNAPSKPPPDVPEQPKEEVKPKKPWTRLQYVANAICSQYNICALLGILWSAFNISMPTFLSTFVVDLETAVFSAGLFTVGAMIAFHPIRGAPIVDVIVGCVIHLIVQPLLALAFASAFSLESNAAKYIVIANCSPTASYAVMCGNKIGLDKSVISYTHVWSTIFVLPFFMIWLAIINETKVFD